MFAYIFGPLLFGWYGIFFGPCYWCSPFTSLMLPELIACESIRPYTIDPGVEAVPPPSIDAVPDYSSSAYCRSHFRRASISRRPRRVRM
jgi:hypothetical protein